MPPSPSGRSSRRSGSEAATTSCSSKPTSPNSKARLLAPSATFPPQDVIAAVPGQTAERRERADLVRAETVEKGHGRIEIRRIRVRTKLPARLDQAWSGLKAICRIERIRELKDRCSREVIYAITSLDPALVGAAGLPQLSRDHWQIETVYSTSATSRSARTAAGA